jgi:hypothetical protein
MPLGGRHGLSLKAFTGLLQGFWADYLARWAVDTLVGFKRALWANLTTQNCVYGYVAGKSEDDIRGLEPIIRDAVLADENCVHAGRLEKNCRTGERNPDIAQRNGLKYAMAPAMKNNVFDVDGKGTIKVGFWRDGTYYSCGPERSLYRRVVQIMSVPRLKQFERYGIYAPMAGGGRGYGRKLIGAMNLGYPR